jgi:hypothetical protein
VRTASWTRRATHRALNSAPNAKPAQQAIINPAKLPRARQIDLCGLCHAGVGVAKAAPFSFVAGNVLANYIEIEKPKPDEPLDVHGNQLELLERSKCFKSSNMTCSTCHDVHQPQRDPAYFSDSVYSVTRCRVAACFPNAAAHFSVSASIATCRTRIPT